MGEYEIAIKGVVLSCRRREYRIVLVRRGQRLMSRSIAREGGVSRENSGLLRRMVPIRLVPNKRGVSPSRIPRREQGAGRFFSFTPTAAHLNLTVVPCVCAFAFGARGGECVVCSSLHFLFKCSLSGNAECFDPLPLGASSVWPFPPSEQSQCLCFVGADADIC